MDVAQDLKFYSNLAKDCKLDATTKHLEFPLLQRSLIPNKKLVQVNIRNDKSISVIETIAPPTL